MVTKQQTKIAAQQWSKVDNWKELHCVGGGGGGREVGAADWKVSGRVCLQGFCVLGVGTPGTQWIEYDSSIFSHLSWYCSRITSCKGIMTSYCYGDCTLQVVRESWLSVAMGIVHYRLWGNHNNLLLWRLYTASCERIMTFCCYGDCTLQVVRES